MPSHWGCRSGGQGRAQRTYFSNDFTRRVQRNVFAKRLAAGCPQEQSGNIKLMAPLF